MIDFKTATRPENLQLLIDDASRVSMSLTSVALRHGGEPITPGKRDELLAKLKAGEHVELELDVIAYEQAPGEHNRKFIRIRDGAVMTTARTAIDRPVLRDHDQGNSLAVGGRVTMSKGEKLDGGRYRISQTWVISAPWLVDLALRNLLSTVSAGLRGPMVCSECNTPVLSQCWHLPGDRLSEQLAPDGTKRKVKDRTGPTVVEWILTSAEIVEMSITPVPAVPSARIEGIRAALSAHDGGIAPPGEQHDMNPELLKLLGLAATAGDSEVLSAVTTLKTAAAELKVAQTELAAANKEVEILTKEKRKGEEDTFIRDALASGRIAKGDEDAWRDLFSLSPERARTRMSAKPEGSATPAGQPRQSGTDTKDPKAAKTSAGTGGDPIAQTEQVLSDNGVDINEAVRLAQRFGVKGDPKKAIAQHCIGLEVT